MATKLQELLDELKGLKRFIGEADDGDFNIIEVKNGKFVYFYELDHLITKYTETTPTYKPGDSVRVIRSLPSLNGQIFELLKKEQGMWQMENSEGRYWFEERQFEPINKKI